MGARTSFAFRTDGNGGAVRLTLAQAAGPAEGDFVWVHLDGDDPDALAWLDGEDHLPAAACDALRATETRPRATPIGEGAIINLRGPTSQAGANDDVLASIRLWAERGRVVTFAYRALDALGPVCARFHQGRVLDPGDLIAAMAEAITQRLDPQVAALGDRLDDLESAFSAGRTDMRDALGDVRRDAVQYRRFLLPQRDALKRLVSPEFGWLADDDRAHIREAADRAQRMAEELDSVRDRAGVLAAQMTDRRSDDANQRMLVLSIVACVFLPLTFLSGLMGMNVGGLPGKGGEGFPVVVVVCVGIAVGMLLWFRRRGWV